MTKTEAHELLNAAQAGMFVPDHLVMQALMATGDLSPVKRVRRRTVGHNLPDFVTGHPSPPKTKRGEAVRYEPTFPKLIHKPFQLEEA